MSNRHPEIDSEQAYLDHAYVCLEAAREDALRLRNMVEVGQGGTEQARYEREVIHENILSRLAQLQLGDAALVFGRIDRADDSGDDGGDDRGGDRFYIGRIGVADRHREPLVVDWRAPVAEPFYRATGRQPMGLRRRRHFATRGRVLLAIEDELFGDARTAFAEMSGYAEATGSHSALIAALETARTGKLGDIVATIQGEQDEIIRADLPGVLVVQGGPGTGKTVVALHRAAYLLYTYRFPLEGQGVLVVGPNRLFLAYIDQVLPSLGEAGVELAVLPDLVPDVRIRGADTGLTARVKGDLRMSPVLAKAIRDRRRPLRRDLRIGVGVGYLSVTVEQSEAILADARRRARTHNAGRRHVEGGFYQALADSSRTPINAAEVRSRVRDMVEVREALEWMWPVLTPAQFLHDLFGSRALLRLAGHKHLSEEEQAALHRPRSEHVDDVIWRVDDAPLLDEALAILGPKSRKVDPEVRTYGHIVVDEAQDLSPMQLRMLSRRSLGGSMTIVGDIAQATGAWAHDSWDEVLAHLPERRPPRRAELTLGYRIPAPTMRLAASVLSVAAPDLTPPRSVREDGDEPRVLMAQQGRLLDEVLDAVKVELEAVDPGNVAVICSSSYVEPLARSLDAAGIEYGRATRHGLDARVTLVPVGLVKGLEVDAAVVVEPGAIVGEEAQGVRALYVALTRSTKRLAVVHEQPLPDFFGVRAD